MVAVVQGGHTLLLGHIIKQNNLTAMQRKELRIVYLNSKFKTVFITTADKLNRFHMLSIVCTQRLKSMLKFTPYVSQHYGSYAS